MILGQHIGKALCDALGLPKYTKSFTLRVEAGKLVTVECEYALETDLFVTELAQFHLVPANDRARAVAHPADVMGYDAWLTKRNEMAHRAFMARTSRLP